MDITGDFLKISSVSFVGANYAVNPLIPTITPPSGDGVMDLAPFGGAADRAPSQIIVVPFGDGADNATGTLRVTGWQKIGTLYVPCPICEATITLSGAIGVNATAVVALQRFADTIVTVAPSSGLETIFSPADNRPGWIKVIALGFRKLQIQGKLGTATGVNALVMNSGPVGS